MSKEYIVLAPGPVHLHPKIQEILSQQTIHHRTPEFEKIFSRTLQNLKSIFQTQNPCFIYTCTGSGGMEALLVNVLNPGDQVLGIESGKFGERWCEMVQAFGASLISLKVPWGQSVKVEEVERLLNENPKVKVVICQATETSTGAKHPIQKLGALIKERPHTLFLVDAITALGAYHLPMDEWYIDGLVGGSQKSFMLPTGLSFVSFSKKAWREIDSAKCPRFYFDVRKEKTANEKGESYFSSNVTLIRALDWALQEFKSQGLLNVFAEIKRRQQSAIAFGEHWGLSVYPDQPSESLTVLKLPKEADGAKIRSTLEQKYGFTIMGGQDQLKGKVLRIGHMGYLPKDLLLKLYDHLSDVLIEQHPDIFNHNRKAEVLEKCQKIL
jgi:aspartate aminotransferase-like enzyme